MMRALLKDKEQWEILNELGVVKIPFLKEDELEKMRAFYSEVHPDGTLQ